MLAHGVAELQALAADCALADHPATNGWALDEWLMTDDQATSAVTAYNALLAGDAPPKVIGLLQASGIDLSKLLYDVPKPDITRSDLTELAAAASLMAHPGCTAQSMHMPNVPKMSRRKSDSGIDVFSVELSNDTTLDDLDLADQLLIASVKHTVDDNTSGMRYKLAASLSDAELTQTYLTCQLRVLHGRLVQEGWPKERADRVYLFLRDFPSAQHVRLYAIGVADPSLRDDLLHHVGLLPRASGNLCFRMILLPGLDSIHERCM